MGEDSEVSVCLSELRNNQQTSVVIMERKDQRSREGPDDEGLVDRGTCFIA